MLQGDTEKQASLRDESIKKKPSENGTPYISSIHASLSPGAILIDVGCGTGHIISRLAAHNPESHFIGLDASNAMIKLAEENTKRFSNTAFVLGDCNKLPFDAMSADIMTCRLADYAPTEIHRVLKKDGLFFEYGCGPNADLEIREFFPGRIDKENYFFPKDPMNWKEEVADRIREHAFVEVLITEHQEDEYLAGIDDLMNYIEMVPLLIDFDRAKDYATMKEFEKKYRNDKGINITWHYYVLQAKKL